MRCKKNEEIEVPLVLTSQSQLARRHVSAPSQLTTIQVFCFPSVFPPPPPHTLTWTGDHLHQQVWRPVPRVSVLAYLSSALAVP
jgi:hypothetical protein